MTDAELKEKMEERQMCEEAPGVVLLFFILILTLFFLLILTHLLSEFGANT